MDFKKEWGLEFRTAMAALRPHYRKVILFLSLSALGYGFFQGPVCSENLETKKLLGDIHQASFGRSSRGSRDDRDLLQVS